jgi:hypothetical protein
MTPELLKKFADGVNELLGLLPEIVTPELSQVSLKLSEAVMWAKMSHDMEKAKNFQPSLELKSRSKFYEGKKEESN